MAKKAAKKGVVEEHKLTSKCAGHVKHMCELVRVRNMDEVARLAKDAKYVCHICGRAAAKGTNLCEAVEI